jgi:hypothetical protein
MPWIGEVGIDKLRVGLLQPWTAPFIHHGEPADDRVDLVANLFIALELDHIKKRRRSISVKLTLRGLCGVYANCGLALPKGVIF